MNSNTYTARKCWQNLERKIYSHKYHTDIITNQQIAWYKALATGKEIYTKRSPLVRLCRVKTPR